MTIRSSTPDANQVQSVFDALSNLLIDLPDQQRIQAQKHLQTIQSFFHEVQQKSAAGNAFLVDHTTDQVAVERKQASEAKFSLQTRDILESISDGFFELDRHYHFTYMNPSAASKLGKQPEDLIGKNLWELYPALLGTEQERLFRQVMDSRQPAQAEIHGAVTPYWYDYRIYPSQAGITVYSTDITERKQAEQALHLAYAQLRFYIDSNLIGVVIGSEDGTLVEVNDYYLNLLGYTRAEYQAGSLDWRNITPPEYLSADEIAIAELKEHGICTPYEKEYFRKDGSRVWVYLRDVLLPNGTIGAIVLDITKRKRVEQALADSESRLRKAASALRETAAKERARANELETLMDAVPAIIWISRDPQCREMVGNVYGYQFLRMGPTENLSKTGPAESVARQPFENMKDGRPIPISELPMQIAAATGKPTRDYEFDIVFHDGKVCHLLGNINPLFDQAGNPSGAIGAFVDVTSLRHLQEDQMEAKANMEVQRRLTEQREQERQMIARDIHDGPIQTLVSTIFNIQMAKEALHDPQMRVELNQIGLSIKNTIQELRYIVNELRPPALLHFGLSRMIRMHCADFIEKHPELELDHTLADDQDRLSEATCLTFYRICQEALNNVVHHAGATRANVRFFYEGNMAVLEVEDNGKGFALTPDLITQIAKGHYGIAGMKERTEAANGIFQIQSAPGIGTTIRIMIPVNET